jgi:hypothetical protein
LSSFAKLALMLKEGEKLNNTVNNGGGRSAPLPVSGSYVVNNDGHGSVTLNIGSTQLHFALFMVSNNLFRLFAFGVM